MIVVFYCVGIADSAIMPPINYWELIVDKFSAGHGAIAARSHATASARLLMRTKRRQTLYHPIWRARQRISGVGKDFACNPACALLLFVGIVSVLAAEPESPIEVYFSPGVCCVV